MPTIFSPMSPQEGMKDAIAPVWRGPCFLNAEGGLSEIFVIINIMLVDVVVTNNLDNCNALSPHWRAIVPHWNFFQVATCCNQHFGIVWLLHYINIKFLYINYSRNGTKTAYILPIKVILHCLSINIICPEPPF